MLLLYIVLACVALRALLARYSPQIYDAVILHMTAVWYATVLRRLPRGASLLDVGIGTASALLANAPLLDSNDVSIVGIDYDAPYIEAARAAVAAHGVTRRVKVHCMSVYDADALSALRPPTGDLFDAAYFSGSLTLMPNPVAAIVAVARMVKPGGLIYVTQTYQRRALPLLAWVKPLLKYATTIDFGQLTYEHDVRRIYDEAATAAGVRVTEHAAIPGSLNNRLQVARLSILEVPS